MEKSQRTELIIQGLLNKPSKKPDFKNFRESDILKRAQQFIPMFIQTTDRLLSDPELLKQKQMDIQLEENGDLQMEMRRLNGEYDQDAQQDPNTINMDIGVGVYDVNNENFDEKNFKPSSTRPIVRFNGLIENEEDGDDSSSDDGSDDSNLYYEFNSDSENTDAASLTTIATNKQQSQPMQRPPLIQDITPANMQQECIQQKGKKNSKKRLRR
ncbi:UNKNOWN [Stylonychia lemnae]|uniref:Uncharacterized protein n=1 Tax=Stylonychia lemnae TaxID=5949 RepID=A0A078AQF3_STYLE|nr:UNKNOWN [Stylonychia lemnae]|eukprot:CDW83482.1 UNKNOWN [Stylonychia lemnae]